MNFFNKVISLTGDGGIAMWSPGAWWLGLPLLCTGLILPSPVFFMFPRWIKEPRWLRHRHNRKRKLEEKREARRLELVQIEKERRRRHRRKKKREMELEKQAINLEMSSAVEGAAVSRVQNGESRTGPDSNASPSTGSIESHPNNDLAARQHSVNDGTLTENVEAHGEARDGAKSSEDECVMAENSDGEEDQSDGHDADVNRLAGHNNGAAMNGRQEADTPTRHSDHELDGANNLTPSETQQPSNNDGVETELPQTIDNEEEDGTTETKKLDTSKSEQQNRRRYALGRKLAGRWTIPVQCRNELVVDTSFHCKFL